LFGLREVWVDSFGGIVDSGVGGGGRVAINL
jgi:hypothetical protein